MCVCVCVCVRELANVSYWNGPLGTHAHTHARAHTHTHTHTHTHMVHVSIANKTSPEENKEERVFCFCPEWWAY